MSVVIFDSTRPLVNRDSFALGLARPEPLYGDDDVRTFFHPAESADIDEAAVLLNERPEDFDAWVDSLEADGEWPTFIIGADVPAGEWPSFTDRTVFGLGRGPIRDADLYPAGATS